MVIRKVQKQAVYGEPSKRAYYRLRLPHDMASKYVEECGEQQHIRVESPDTLCIGPDDGADIRILDVREMRKAIYKHFRQVMFPVWLCGGMEAGDEVDVTRDGDTIRLKFGREMFAV